MIKISPLNIYNSSTNYNNIVFSFNPTTLTVNISGTLLNHYIKKSITINKKDLLAYSIKLNNSLTVLYTYLTIDLQSYTYITSITKLNSTDIYKPEFLLFLDDSLNCINDVINNLNLINFGTFIYSITANYSLKSFYSLSSDISKLTNISNTSTFSLTALYSSNTVFIPNNIFDIEYSKLFVGTSFPNVTSWFREVFEYDSFYNTNTKEMFIFISNTWHKVNWQNFIKNDWLYNEGRLRINPSTTALEIQSANGNWHEIIPTIGKVFTPKNYNDYIYYIAPGQSFYYKKQNNESLTIIPIIATNGLSYNIKMENIDGNNWYGLYPSGLLINDGTSSQIYKKTTNYITNKNFIPVYYSPKRFSNWYISINNKLFISSFANSTESIISQGYGTFPINGYYLGIFTNQYSETVSFINLISIKREL
jgi:hypothetical protein